MGLPKKILIVIWRIWFYVLMALPILILFPALLVFTSREKWYPQFFVLARFWATIILYGSGFIPKVKNNENMNHHHSYMFIANHTSMADIMLILYCVKNPFVFVGKKELTKIPLFGFFYKRTCILVDRNSQKSKNEVFKEAKKRLDSGISICIFPEGGVPDDESIVLDEFKDGAFRLAIDYQIPIVPLTFLDNKKRFSYTFLSGSPGKMRAIIHPMIRTKGLTQEDKKNLKSQSREIILESLLKSTTS
ncbi:lysophospholipid acyltransferase family protein [Aquimarina sp. W85]|uniref:lysophospholipid acyltransferase family protein n=1 Tax=Aquimarina rhodophyticola TaxID=3342246 RepID=UPI00366C951A